MFEVIMLERKKKNQKSFIIFTIPSVLLLKEDMLMQLSFMLMQLTLILLQI